jgi:SAM-dependent methyltransferase
MGPREVTDRGSARLSSPATQRNRDPILAVLRQVLPGRGLVLEVASGAGEHVVHFAHALPHLTFQPTDRAPEALASIAAWADSIANIRPPLCLDAASQAWPIEAADALIAINMVHISPWAATEGLIRGAGRLLPAGGVLYLYGPYLQEGVPTAPSNLAFDASLKARNPAWGLRKVADLAALAEAQGFRGPVIAPMPANNLSLVFSR